MEQSAPFTLLPKIRRSQMMYWIEMKDMCISHVRRIGLARQRCLPLWNGLLQTERSFPVIYSSWTMKPAWKQKQFAIYLMITTSTIDIFQPTLDREWTFAIIPSTPCLSKTTTNLSPQELTTAEKIKFAHQAYVSVSEKSIDNMFKRVGITGDNIKRCLDDILFEGSGKPSTWKRAQQQDWRMYKMWIKENKSEKEQL